MDDRPTREWRDRNGDRPTAGSAYRRGTPRSRASQRRPAYGGQARREARYGPYVIGFIVVVAALATFLYLGLNWATGPGRVASLASQPTPTSIAIQPPVAPAAVPSPPAGEQVYIVKAGDTPAAIAAQHQVKVEDLLAANNIDDPRRLQIGQTLKIPAPTSNTP